MNLRPILMSLVSLWLLSACNSTSPQAAGPDAAPSAPVPDPLPEASAMVEPPPPPGEADDEEQVEGGGGAEGTAAEAESEDAPAPAPQPNVEVKNIGMHIGGGPNDRETKAPIKNSVDPHMDAFRACFAKVEDPKKGGDFGVDIRIEREGGKAGVSHPRSALKGEGFKECVVQVFEAIEFQKPKTGATVVSYSLRFTPAK